MAALERDRAESTVDRERPLLAQWLRRTESRLRDLEAWLKRTLGEEAAPGLLDTVETELKYTGYIRQQDRHIARLRESDGNPIPESFSYSGIPASLVKFKRSLRACDPQLWARQAGFLELLLLRSLFSKLTFAFRSVPPKPCSTWNLLV